MVTHSLLTFVTDLFVKFWCKIGFNETKCGFKLELVAKIVKS